MVRFQLQGRDIRDAGVLAVMGRVPRHQFVPSDLKPLAYADRPLPIGHDQTISQPYIVALMTQLAMPRPTGAFAGGCDRRAGSQIREPGLGHEAQSKSCTVQNNSKPGE